jgi:cytoskeletal protein CcmA (bactofilin family)
VVPVSRYLVRSDPFLRERDGTSILIARFSEPPSMFPLSRYRPARRALLVVLLVVAVVTGSAGVVTAQFTETGGNVVVEEGETVDGIQATAGTVVVRGTVEGSVEAMAGSVVVGDTGRVTGDVRATAGSVSVDGTVEGSVEAAGGSVVVGDGATVGGDLRVGAGSLLLAGTVDGSVEAGVESLRLASTARIGGDLRYARNARFERADGATVGGSVRAVDDISVDAGFGQFRGPDPGPGDLALGIYGVVATLVVGAVVLLAFPGFSRAVETEVAEEPLRAGGVGLLGLVGVPLVLVAVAITVVGLPITFLGLMAYGLAVFVSAVLAEYAVGAWALSLADVEHRWIALLVGVVGVALLSRLPVVGWVVNLAVFLVGFGAVLTSLYRGYREYRSGQDGTTAAL